MISPSSSLALPEEGRIPPSLKVGGVTPFTATDYPGKLAAVVFIQGCPWRCGYCHNPHLQQRPEQGAQRWDQVMSLLSRRKGLIDAVVFSGGEPTLDPALKDAVLEVRALGFGIGLHTSGSYPERLAEVLPLLDWVGMDVKAPFDRYERITGIARSGVKAKSCVEQILASGVAHEFRTTIHPSLLSREEIAELADALAKMGVQNYALQKFRATGCESDRLATANMNGYPSSDLIENVTAVFSHFTMRNA